MQKISLGLSAIWKQIGLPVRILIFFALAVLLCFLVLAAFAWGILLALGVIGGAIIFFPAACAIGYLLRSFRSGLLLYFFLSIFSIIMIGVVLNKFNISSDISAFVAISIVGWIVILIALANDKPPASS